jgi:acyl-CoA hydrolase
VGGPLARGPPLRRHRRRGRRPDRPPRGRATLSALAWRQGRPLVVVGDGPGSPTLDPVGAARTHGVGDGSLFVGWTVDERAWVDDLGTWPAATYLPGYQLAAPLAAGRLRYLPVRLGAIPALLAAELRPALAVVTAVPRGAGFAFTENVGYADTAARLADAVVVQVVDDGVDVGGPAVTGNVVAVVPGGRAPAGGARPPDDVDRRIGRLAASLLDDGVTIQLGAGALLDAVVAAVSSRVSVVSGLVTEEVAALHRRGLLEAPALASYAWGPSLAAMAAAGDLRPVGVEELHRAGRLAATPRFVAINTALQVGLDGSVNIERVGGRQVAGIGGHADYCAAASFSPGGFSIVVLRSTHGQRSTIVPTVEVVSTPATDVHVVVTEHGVADLRGLDLDARRRTLLSVADPAHRDALGAATSS